jgi:hypothetical protein
MASAAKIEQSSNADITAFPGASNTPSFVAKHYTVAEIASLWNLSADAVRQIFEKEPGVLIIGDQKPRGHKRRYRTLRIPELVLERVHKRLTQV